MASSRSWGPEHQDRPAPGQSHGIGRRIALGLVVVWVVWWWGWLHPGSHPFTTLLSDGLVIGALVVGYRFLAARAASDRESDVSAPAGVASSLDPFGLVRDHAAAAGGGAYLGANRGAWVFADPEHGVLLLGPPRSGKTSGVVIPALLAAPGACVSTSTKLDVLHATLAARRRSGDVWLFDPTGEHAGARVEGVRRLSWSPVAAAGCWDEALLMARAMTLAAPTVGKGTQSEQHWSERAGALLAPLLLAANRSEQPIADVVRWVLRHDLDEPGAVLEREQAEVACDVLEGIARTDQRERSSIFSATAGVLALYSTDAAREAAAAPNFDPDQFAGSSDTVFITAPAHRQALCAPLVVGLLEQIRHATYRRAASGIRGLPVFLCLDEVANIAPIHDLPALVSEAGGQGLHVLACLQDLSQARARWGDQAADGMLSLFQTKLILPGVCDPKTLEAVSLVLGEYDRQLVSSTIGVTRSSTSKWSPETTTHSETVAYSTTRQRTLSPGEVAAIPTGRALLVRGASWGLLHATPFYATAPWSTLARHEPGRDVDTGGRGGYAARIGRPGDAGATRRAVISTERS
ncbi:MAG TPA: type IV secretory system conjugative DNA transfer family protein [Solirubrobacteraceae bacterium]